MDVLMMKVPEAAALLGVSRAKPYELIASGALPAVTDNSVGLRRFSALCRDGQVQICVSPVGGGVPGTTERGYRRDATRARTEDGPANRISLALVGRWMISHGGATAPVRTVCVRATRLEGVRVELSYDRAGSRLRRIGDFQISYDRAGSRPKTLGHLDLDYDMTGNRLRRVGADQIEYDKLGSRPARLGDLELAYDRLGSRLVRVGTLGVEYDMAGNRVRRIGGLTVDYDKLGSRPRYLRAEGEEPLDEQKCVIVFLVLVAFHGDA